MFLELVERRRVAHGRSDALRSGSDVVLVALVVAYVAIRPLRAGAPSAIEKAEESIALTMIE